MKHLLFVCLVGFVFLGVQTGYAQNENLMGFSTDPLNIEQCAVGTGNQIYLAHAFISRPVNNDFEGGEVRQVEWISGFECRAWVEGDAILLGWTFPVNAIDAGVNGNTMVGFATPVPVVDRFVVVGTVQIFMAYPTGQTGGDSDGLKVSPLPCDNATGFLYMKHTMPLPSIPDMMAYLDAEDTDDPLVGATLYGALGDDLAMQLEVQPVATEPQTWGGVKALYR